MAVRFGHINENLHDISIYLIFYSISCSVNVNATLGKSGSEDFGSGRVLTSGVRVAEYPTRHSPIHNIIKVI